MGSLHLRRCQSTSRVPSRDLSWNAQDHSRKFYGQLSILLEHSNQRRPAWREAPPPPKWNSECEWCSPWSSWEMISYILFPFFSIRRVFFFPFVLFFIFHTGADDGSALVLFFLAHWLCSQPSQTLSFALQSHTKCLRVWANQILRRLCFKI